MSESCLYNKLLDTISKRIYNWVFIRAMIFMSHKNVKNISILYYILCTETYHKDIKYIILLESHKIKIVFYILPVNTLIAIKVLYKWLVFSFSNELIVTLAIYNS
jgi:hypothetical protein